MKTLVATGLPWHTIRRDDPWRQVMLPHVERLGGGVWVHRHRGRQRVADHGAFSADGRMPMMTPLPFIAFRMRRTTCGEMTVHVWPELYSMSSTAR